MSNLQQAVQKPPVRRGALWLSINMGVPNTILDAPLRRFLFSRAPNLVVLNGELAGYRDLVEAIKHQVPTIKVLRYTNAQRIPETRVASTMFQHFWNCRESEVLRRVSDGQPKIAGDAPNRTIYTDITVPAARRFIVSHLAEQVAAHGADGVAIDSFHADLEPNFCLDWDIKARQWPGACAAILKGLRAALPGKLIWFNGIWSFDGQPQVDAQSALLEFADGASVEFYGYDGTGRITDNTFDVFVERINAVLAANPDKPLMVRGTTPSKYYDYVTHLRQARYCFGCYLLAETSASFFNFGQSFQLTRLQGDRTGGAAMFSYFDLPLGTPAGPAADNGNAGKSRRYDGGVVFVAPAGRGTQTWTVTTDGWTTTGIKYVAGSSLVLAEGDATILLRERPSPPSSTLEINTADSTHEWWVDGVSGEYRYLTLNLSVRSTDPASAVLVRFETNDDPRPFGILAILPESGTFVPDNRDCPYGLPPTLGAAHPAPLRRYSTNGAWTDIAINLDDACGTFPCFRVMSVRVIGSVEVGLIRLGKPAPILESCYA